MFIDIHVHTRRVKGPFRRNGTTFATPDELVEQFDECGIETAVILPSATPECCNVMQTAHEALDICEQYPGRFVAFCNIDPRAMTNSPDAPLGEMIEFYKDRGCKGIGELTANLPFLDPMVQNLFKHAEQAEMPITFHIAHRMGGIYGVYDDPGLPQLEESLKRFKNLRFLAHSQSFWAEMAPLEKPADRGGYPGYPIRTEGVVPKLMRQYPNLLGDLSAGSGCNALARDEKYAAKFLDEFQDKLFFGTDICTAHQKTPLVDLLIKMRDEGSISETVFRKVARENAAKLLGLQI